MSYLFGIAHDASSNTDEDSKAIVPAKRATRDARPTTHEGSLNLTRANTYWANPVNFNPTFSSTDSFYEDFSSGDRPYDRSKITRWEFSRSPRYMEVTFEDLAAFSDFSGLRPDFEIRTQAAPQPLFRGTYEFSSIIASSIPNLTIRYEPQFTSATNEPYGDPQIPWDELVASVYSGSGIQLNLEPSSFIEHAWRAGPETRLPDYDPVNPPYMQVKIKVQGLSNFTGGSQGFDWQTGETFPAIWAGLGFSLSANDLYGGTGQHLILSNAKLRSSGSSQWTSNVFNIPLDDPVTGEIIAGACYNRPGDYIWENIDIDGYDEENDQPFYSLKWGTREYALQNRTIINCDFSRINQEHGSYVGLNGDFLKQGCTLSSIGSQGTQIAHRSSAYSEVYNADNNPYDRRCTWTIRDNHYYNMADTALAGERPAFTFTNFSPGNSQFPATVVAEDCSIVCNFDTPIDSGNKQSGETEGGKSRSSIVATRQPKDNPDYIYNVISTSVANFGDLPSPGSQDQLIRVTNDASTYHWDGTQWENWGDVSGNPIDEFRLENCLIHTVKQGKNEHILLRSVNNIIFKHNCIIYDKGDDPSWINDEYRINIDAETFGDTGHGQLSTSLEDSNAMRSKKLILANNIGVGRNGGTIKFQIYHTKYRGNVGGTAESGVVYSYELDATNNLGKYTVIDLEALDVTESTSFADLQVTNGANESTFVTTVTYDPLVHGAYPTESEGTGNHISPPGASPNQYLAPPTSATIVSPEEGSVLDSPSQVNIDWVEAASANGYKIYISDDLEALNTVSPVYNGDTDRVITGLTGGTGYVFKVVPYNFFGDADAETRTFTTQGENPGSSPPSQSTGLTPANDATGVSVDSICQWDTDLLASGYDVYFASALGAEFTASRGNQLGTTFDPGTLEFNKQYYWRVDTINEFGLVEGQTFSFTTETESSPPPPDPPDPPDPPSEESSSTETSVRVNQTSEVISDWNSSDYESRNRSYPTREGDVVKKIFKMTQAKANVSFVYRESLRSMIASFNDIGYFNSEDEFVDIRCIHGNAERTIAKLKQENSIILPIISISQTVSDNDDNRRRYESILVHEKYWDKEKHRAFRILSLAPRPVNVKYQINIWCKYMADMDQILEQVRLKFNPEMNVPTTYSTLAKATIDSEEAVGSMAAKDKEDRVIKKTINVTLKTYVPSPKFLVTSTGEIEEIKNDIIID